MPKGKRSTTTKGGTSPSDQVFFIDKAFSRFEYILGASCTPIEAFSFRDSNNEHNLSITASDPLNLVPRLDPALPLPFPYTALLCSAHSIVAIGLAGDSMKSQISFSLSLSVYRREKSEKDRNVLPSSIETEARERKKEQKNQVAAESEGRGFSL